MTYSDFRSQRYVPLEVLDMLIIADLGDTPQCRISREQFEAAMRGHQVKRRGPRPWKDTRQRYEERRAAYVEAMGW